ncbi:unnamed protein product [Gordionus sp. m RMFG-2023]
MSSLSRKEELEKKKAKLALIREEKRKREEEKKQKEMATEVYSNLPDLNKSYEADDVLRDLGIIAPKTLTKIENGFDIFSDILNTSHINLDHSENILNKTQERLQKLSLSSITSTNIPSKDKVYYNKEVQINMDTEQSPDDKNKLVHDYYGEVLSTPSYCWDDEFSVLTYANHDENEFDDNILPSIDNPNTNNSLHNIGLLRSYQANIPLSQKKNNQHNIDDKLQIIELSEEEKLQIIADPHFKGFIDHCSKIVRRVLSDNYDISIDYSQDSIENQKFEKGESNKLTLNNCIFDDILCKNRSITSLDWNHQFPELLAASYYRNEDYNNKDADGQVLIWNTRFKDIEPEYIFNFQSTISTVAFAKFHPNLIIGGCYSGQIVIWDNRHNKRSPVQRTPLSIKAHTHPICGLAPLGTFNSNSLASLSTDGKLLDWSVESLSSPLSCLELLSPAYPVPSLSCISFPTTTHALPPDNYSSNNNSNENQHTTPAHNDDNLFVVGAEQGSIFSARRHGSKNGLNEIYDSHKGPITDLHFNPSLIPEYSHLFLSSSTDWSVKLWSIKPNSDIVDTFNPVHFNNYPTKNTGNSFSNNPSTFNINNLSSFIGSNNSSNNAPLLTLDCYEDYIYSVQWSPVNPLTFALSTGYGQLDLWKLNHSIEEPIFSERVTNSALNKLLWSPSGNQICVGDEGGKIWLYDVGQVMNSIVS